MFSKEFTVDGNRYLLQSVCPQGLWNFLCDRVEKHLIRYGHEAAKSQIGSPLVEGKTKFGSGLVTFKLTLNPEGNTFRES